MVGKEKQVGIQNKITKTSKSVVVYPNPAHSMLYIDLDENENNLITITSMQGKVVKQMPMQSRVIEVDDLTKGIYILNIFDPVLNQTYTTKFIIQ